MRFEVNNNKGYYGRIGKELLRCQNPFCLTMVVDAQAKNEDSRPMTILQPILGPEQNAEAGATAAKRRGMM
jgi:hypothetical protein